MSNPLLQTLYLVRKCGEYPHSAAELAEYLDVSDRTIKRLINDAKTLGAHMRSFRHEGKYLWTCDNWDTIKERGLLERWIELEENRSVVELDDQRDMFK